MSAATGNTRFLKSAILLTPKEIKQLAGLMALRQHSSSDSRKEQEAEQTRIDSEDIELQKAINQYFQVDAVPVDIISQRSAKSKDELWGEIQYRTRLLSEHKKNEAARLAAQEAEGRTARRYYRRGKGSPLNTMLLGSILLGMTYGLYEHSMKAKTARHTFITGENNFADQACHLALGPDSPVHVLDQSESLPNQKVYRVFASCEKAGFLHIQYQQSLPAATFLNIPIPAQASWDLIQALGKPIAIYVSGPQPLRIRYGFSASPIPTTDKLDPTTDQGHATWLREYQLPLSGE